MNPAKNPTKNPTKIPTITTLFKPFWIWNIEEHKREADFFPPGQQADARDDSCNR